MNIGHMETAPDICRIARTILLYSCLVGCVAQQTIVTASTAAADELAEAVERMSQIGAAWSPSFSPDGRRIAFVSDLSGIPQVWTVTAEGGWPRRVTVLQDQVGRVSWSPTGELLAFSLAPGGGMNQQVFLIRPDGTALEQLTDGGKENNWLGDWSHDGRHLILASNRSNARGMDAFVYEQGKDLQLIVKNRGIGILTEFSRDMSKAVVWRMQSRSDSNLFLFDVASGDEILLTPHEPPGTFDGGLFSPDGGAIYLSTNKDRDLMAFGRIVLNENGRPGPIEILVQRHDAELQELELSPDGETAALLWNVAGRSELHFISLKTSRLTTVPLPADIARDLTFSPDSSQLAVVLSGASSPPDIYTIDVRTGKHRQITHSPHAGVILAELVKPQLVEFKAHDGLLLSGWLYQPKSSRKPGPVVLSFHGGPEGQERPTFRSVYQALLANGIAVFAPNVRGSSGFGKAFVNLDNGPLRVNAVKDIESCVDHVIDMKVADPNRIGIMGGSYGGYMVMAGLTEYPDRFAAGANLFGIVNFETFFAETEPWMAAISTIEYGDPKTQRDMLRDLSPIHKIDRVIAPTIVLHGANDTNVPVVEAEQVVDSLKRRGVPVEYVLFQDEGHGFRKASNRLKSTVSIVKWFNQHLKGV